MQCEVQLSILHLTLIGESRVEVSVDCDLILKLGNSKEVLDILDLWIFASFRDDTTYIYGFQSKTGERFAPVS